MTPAQAATIEPLIREGFKLVAEGREIVRVSKGADKRVIFKDGSQKRGQHHN